MNHQAIYNTHPAVKSIRGTDCFDADGNIKTKRPKVKPEKPKRKPMPEGFEEHRADYDWLVANGVI